MTHQVAHYDHDRGMEITDGYNWFEAVEQDDWKGNRVITVMSGGGTHETGAINLSNEEAIALRDWLNRHIKED